VLKRVLTALVLAPAALAAIWFLPTGGVALLFALVIGLGALEWARLIGLGRGPSGVYLAGLLVLLLLSWLLYRAGPRLEYLFLPALLWWLATLALLARFAGGRALLSLPLEALMGYLVLGYAWLALVALHGLESGPYFFTLLLILVWGADTGAYLVGRRFGRRKLAPRISPGKTWEGVAGGLVFALGGALLVHATLGPGWPALPQLLAVALPTVLFSIVGDLFESMIKRQHGAKDSGNLLPGHGGVLDRIDSLTAAAPIFLLCLSWLQAVQ